MVPATGVPRPGVGGAFENRRSHGAAVHVVLEGDPVELLARGKGLLQVEVHAGKVWRRSLAVHVVGAVGRAQGSGGGASCTASLSEEGAGGPLVDIRLERARVRNGACHLSLCGVSNRFISPKNI